MASHRKARRLTFLAATCSAMVGCSSAVPTTPPASVFFSLPLRQKVTDWDSFTGRFEATDRVEVRARVTGRLDGVMFRDGATVHKGELLFKIDPRPFQATVLQAQGKLETARSQLVLARQELDRAKTLIATDTIAMNVYQQRQQAVAAAQAGIVVAQGALDSARLDVEFTQIRAPMSGRIGEKLVSAGNLVNGGDSAGTLLATIVALDPLDLYFDIDEESYLKYMRLWQSGERAYSRLHPNPVRITLPDEAGPSREGFVDFLDNRLDKSTGTLRARARVPNGDLFLSPGQFGRVQLIGSKPHLALLLPDSAVGSDATRRIVTVVDRTNHVVVKAVVLGKLFGALREIRTGLAPDDRVIVDGLQRAVPGTVVAPVVRPIKGNAADVPAIES